MAQWRSPRGEYRSLLPCPAKPVEGQKIYLKIVREADEQEAIDLQGRPVRLGGVDKNLDTRGRAAFRLDELIAKLCGSEPNADLAVGPDWTVWEELPLEAPSPDSEEMHP